MILDTCTEWLQNYLDMFKVKNTLMHTIHTWHDANIMHIIIPSALQMTGFELWLNFEKSTKGPQNDLDVLKGNTSTYMYTTYVRQVQIFVPFALRWAVSSYYIILRKHRMTPKMILTCSRSKVPICIPYHMHPRHQFFRSFCSTPSRLFEEFKTVEGVGF